MIYNYQLKCFSITINTCKEKLSIISQLVIVYFVLRLGYADSTSRATDEQGVVEDTKAVIAWVQERVVTGRVFVWGHSLGTG